MMVSTKKRIAHAILYGVLISITMTTTSSSHAQSYDFENGNAAVEVVIPAILPVLLQDVSSTAGDATLVLRITTQVTNSWYDATAPYHPTAVGVYSRLGRLATPQTNRELNIALLYASAQVLRNLLPTRAAEWDAMLTNVGLNPQDNSTDTTTAIGLGNVAGFAVALGRQNDGMNQLGTEGGRTFNPLPYSDYTGYSPINTPERLFFPSRWQPDIQRKGLGLYKVQKFVTPQYRLVEPYSYPDPTVFRVPFPRASRARNFRHYKAQADEVLEESATLTDEKKIKAELFDNKIESLGFSAVFAALSQGLSLIEFIQLDFLTNMAAHDAGIFVWQEKAKYDAVRPFSAINFIYRNRAVRAYAGPGQGVAMIPANQWKSYLEEADHPEYPSASTCFCSAHAEAARRFLGSDTLNWSFVRPAGSSRVESGITPAADLEIVFPSWTDFVEDCGESRIWAGVHFRAAIEESKKACDRFGELATDYMDSLINGTAPMREPAKGRRL